MLQGATWNDDGGCDVVLCLHFLSGREVLTQLVGAPGTLSKQTDSKIRTNQFSITELEFMSGMPIDDVHRKMLAPILRLASVHSLDNKHDCINVIRDFFEPLVVCVRIVDRRCEQLDDASQRS